MIDKEQFRYGQIVSVVGAGRLGSTVARMLYNLGYRIESVISRSIGPAEELAELVAADVASTDVRDLSKNTTILLLAVPDDELESAAIASTAASMDWETTTVIHFSGALTSEVLEPVAAQGAQVLSFHPLMTFARRNQPIASLVGIYIALEGSDAGLEVGSALAEDLDATAIALTASSKARYHMAASIASNFSVTLMAIAEEILQTIGFESEDARGMLGPLINQSIMNGLEQGPESALTGPIVRGDLSVIRMHTEALRRTLPHLVPVYAALGFEAVRVAVRSGRLDQVQAERILAELQELVDWGSHPSNVA